MKSFDKYFNEEKLTTAERDELGDSEYGIPETRSFPLNDANHVKAAVRMFPHADDKYKKSLAKRILSKAKKFNLDTSGWDSLKSYVESCGPEEDFTTGTSEFDETYNDDPDDCYCESSIFDDEDTDTEYDWLATKLDHEVAFWLEKCYNLWTSVPDIIYSSDSFGVDIIDYLPDDWTLAVTTPDIWKDLIDQTIRCSNAILYTIDEFDKLDPEQKMKHEGVKFDHDELIENINQIIQLANNVKSSSIFNIPDSQHVMTAEEKKQVNDVYDVGNLFKAIAKDWVSKYKPILLRYFQEAYDAITGKEIPIDHAYTMDEMKEITLSITEDAKSDKLMKVSPPDSKYVYFGSPENYMPEIKLDRPLFVTPYKSLASIFIWNDMDLQNRIPKGSYNMQYEEWLKFNKKESGRCLKDVHVYVEGYPDLEPYEIKQTGYVHQILTHNWNDNYYRYPWMDATKEWLIANGNGNVEFDDVTKCEITYHISGKPGHDKLGPRQDALESFVRKSIKLIHDKYKKDQIDPIGNQNCLLCTWCFEARMRGLDVLPRPVYSPRDDVLDIPGNQIVFGSRQIKLKNYTDLASEITKAGDDCRFYVHINWKGSKGGHEFVLMRIGGKNFVIDPQQGKMEPLTKSHNYVSDINYDNSYIVQLSDKKFNRNLFDKWNDESTVLRWDPEKDIPYMLKEGMITEEEAEKELRKSSTERFTSELKRELKNHPVQEGVIQNIKNKVSPFEKQLVYHISPDGHLDGQVFKPRVPDYLDKYDPSKTEFEDVETPRVCFSPSIEGCLNAILVNIGRWKTAEKLRDWYVYIPEKPLKEYKYRTNKQLVDEKKVYDANITKEIWIEEPVRLKQYGIIRIDSVTDKSRKKAVPTTTGESKKRNYYDFKWHWLVKPKVLKDVPYNYSPLEVCKDMVDELYGFKYGIPENGKIVNGSEHDYDTKWKLQSPEEFEKNKGGICFDYVEFEEGYLDAYGIKCKKYFVSTTLPGNDTHTFILVDDGKGGFVYPESSFEKVAGTHEIKSVEEAIKIVADGFWKINDNINKTNEFKYYVWEFTGHPKYGSSIQKCIEYYTKGEPFFESNCLKPEAVQPKQTASSQPIREFVTNFRNK